MSRAVGAAARGPVEGGAQPRGQHQKELGAFYTPDHAVDAALDLVSPDLLTGATLTGPILEPSGGDGAFVRGLRRRHVAPDAIEVWDLNPETAPVITSLGARFWGGDSLLRDVTAQRGTYRLIVGNPPYLGKGSPYLQQQGQTLAARYPHVSHGEVYGMFVALALELLAPGGELVFVVSDTWRTLSTHEPLRRLLLAQTTLCNLVLLPRALFAASGATVDTCLLHVRKGAPPRGHRVTMRNCRDQPVGTYDGPTVRVAQRTIASWPKAILPWADRPTRETLALMLAQPVRFLDRMDGGLGLYTRDNARYCARVRPADATSRIPRQIDPARVDGRRWRIYHKTGGRRDWWAAPTTALAWDATSRATYIAPASFTTTWRASRTPLILSGVSDRLSARVGARGAVWNSNKCFGFVPRDEAREPVLFWVAVLNSSLVRQWMRLLNHTVSLQMSDLALLRVPAFSRAQRQELGRLALRCVRAQQRQRPLPDEVVARIDTLVARAAARARGRRR